MYSVLFLPLDCGCGFPVRGASLCMFQWVYHLRDGTRQYIEGATNPEYVVAADDMDKLIAIECIPMDDRGLQVAASPNGDGNGDAGEITHCHCRSRMGRLIT
ncbi:uncharacterized protein LOC131329082 isoform X1 [Rhododendron vialii]|uniref:uncharacterized protein LOC131329082 isoform X1 n=2 Tax=Rhododendron vialii TaxID=182163 RepID=UPI002660305C|nr:uncharacterized protein LOC131329082 isoform X1 [Rhododendron vialii]XP_058218130.1 uncharacterized protein LOC131329082 isoform X1 [Rhododendron vialii]